MLFVDYFHRMRSFRVLLKVQVTQRTCKFKKCFLLTLNFGMTSHNSFVIFNTFLNTTCTICTRHITLRTTVYLMVMSVGTMKVFMSFHIRFACAQQPTPITFPSLPLGVANFMTSQFFFRIKCKTAYITFIHQRCAMG